jgi:peroxiredoxin
MRTLPVIALAFATTLAAQAPAPSPAEAAIIANIKTLRATPDSERGAKTAGIAVDIRKLPAGPHKVSLALGLAERATEGDFGRDNLQQVTTTLAESLRETPMPGKDGKPAEPYMELAELVRYEGMTTSLSTPELTQATEMLVRKDAEIQHADFTLTDLKGKQWTLSKLRGKIVVVNFWATWCPPCRKEMPDLDAIYTHDAKQGLVVLSISDEDRDKVAPFIEKVDYHPTVLLDPGDKVHQLFHVEGIPHTFIFDRSGHLVTQSIDMRTMGQFQAMLAKAGLKS